jgi:molybdopterin synthase sulfur carrier subunit
MEVYVKAYADIGNRINLESGQGVVDLPQASTLNDLIKTIDLPENVARVVLVNGKAADNDMLLNGNDKVTLFPPVEGG